MRSANGNLRARGGPSHHGDGLSRPKKKLLVAGRRRRSSKHNVLRVIWGFRHALISSGAAPAPCRSRGRAGRLGGPGQDHAAGAAAAGGGVGTSAPAVVVACLLGRRRRERCLVLGLAVSPRCFKAVDNGRQNFRADTTTTSCVCRCRCGCGV